MDIQCIGEKSFKLSGKTVTLIIFPPKSVKADIIIDESNTHEAGKVINEPGEYEIKGVSIFGFTYGYFISLEDVRIFYALSAEYSLTDDDASKVGEIDVLIVPVGKNTEQFISKLTPSVVVPFGNTAEYIEKQGLPHETEPKLTVKAGSLLSDTTKTVLLSHS